MMTNMPKMPVPRRSPWSVLAGLMLVASGCGDPSGSTTRPPTLADASLPDALLADASLADASLADASLADASLADASLADASLADAFLADQATPDLPESDAPSLDSSVDLPVDAPIVADGPVADTPIADGPVADAPIADAALVDALVDSAPDLPPGPPPCDLPLSIDPPASFIRALDLRVLHAEGGSGDYTFTLLVDGSGALLNEFTGAYLSGDIESTTDIIEVTDSSCVGSAIATVQVVPSMEIHPVSAVLRFGQSIDYVPLGGSGIFSYALSPLSQSGGSVDATGRYVAGGNEGRDIVHIVDEGTGQQDDAVVQVEADARLRGQPGRIALPLGSTYLPRISGGSGEFGVALVGEGGPGAEPFAVTLRDGLLVGLSSGEAVVRLTDRFTFEVVDVPVVVDGPLSTPIARGGDNLFFPTLAGPIDINGDGFPDVALGLQEADHNGFNSGSVLLYAGRPDGLDSVPARVVSGLDRRDEFGRGLAVADLNADGLVDLIVGAPVADAITADAGAVYIYRGVLGGFFEAEPAYTLSSRRANDRFGQSVGVCDLNGDGRLDLVVGAIGLDDLVSVPNATDQGGLFVYLGYEDGFLPMPDQRIVARTPDGLGGSRSTTNPRFGHLVATGDFDADGLCDVATVGLSYALTPPRAADGAVLYYRGQRPDAVGPGGLSPIAARFITASLDADPDSVFGRVISAGDVNGDGRSDLLVGQPNHDFVAGRADNHGAVRLYLGADFPPVFSLEAAEVAEWSYEHVGPADAAGQYVVAADGTGDGLADIITGNWRDELLGGIADVGLIQIHAGVASGLPDLVPSRTFVGRNRDERLSNAILPLPDYDGDGLPELFAYLPRAPDEGYEVGLPLILGGPTGSIIATLSNVGPASGSEVGRAVGFNDDLDGDGDPEIVVGAQADDAAALNINAGVAYLHPLRINGPEREPSLTLSRFIGHSGSDLFGGLLTNAGDFDGDGRSDLVIMARADDRPAAAPAGFTSPPDCLGALGDTGAAYLWRGQAAPPLSAQPSMAWFPSLRNSGTQALAGGFDANGDGLTDLLVGGDSWDVPAGPAGPGLFNVGAFQLLYGRPALGPSSEYICGVALEGYGIGANFSLGRAVVGIGDVDRDGCDEFAVSSTLETFLQPFGGRTAQGVVRIFRGFGGPGCPGIPLVAALVPNENNANAGLQLVGGGDFDLDGRPDLAISGAGHVNGAVTVGGVWILPGAFIAQLAFEPYAGIAAPLFATAFADAGPNLLLQGTVIGEQFGFGLAWVPGRGPNEPSCLAVGAALSDVSGVARAGAVKVFCPEGSGFSQIPSAVIAGETWRINQRFGQYLAAGVAHGRRWIVVGAPEASALSIDYGAAYVFPLDPP